LFREDVESVVAELLRWVRPSAETDLEAVRADLWRVVEDYLLTLRMPQKGTAKGGASAFGMSVLEIVHDHSLVLSPSVVGFFKTLATADAIRYELAPTYDLQEVANRFFRRLAALEMKQLEDPKTITSLLLEGGARLRQWLAHTDDGTDSVHSMPANRAMRVALTISLASAALAAVLLVAGALAPTARQWDIAAAAVLMLGLASAFWRVSSKPGRVRSKGRSRQRRL